MSTVLIRLLTLEAKNVIPEILWAILGIYVCAVLVTLASVWVTNKSVVSRFFWIFVVVGMPFLGILAHCLHCVTLADISSLKQFGFFSRKAA
ncbi:hypothetical protein WJU23_01030 [Prosthecobacter sp. SYSU 5D2]|uniref:hypothetical protein n=1 Tax=Prosthecobacter sp. SYSU 5D2 TaxID=3134134 RepID=UPI0031FE7C90